MLENIRESSQGIVAKIILGFIILTFAVAGIGSYTNQVDTSVAEVNGEKISQADFDKAYQSQRARMSQQFGEMFETLSADSNYMANFRNGVLDQLINETLIKQASNNLALRVSDENIKKVITEMPEFQVNGQFDNNRYLALINQSGFYQSSDFRDYLRQDLTRRQLVQSLIASEFAVPYQEALVASLQNQKRDIKFATIKAAQFADKVELTDEEVNSYYLDNQSRFENQEQVKVDYIALDVNDIAKTVEVKDEDLLTFYQENSANYQKEEQRRVSHILIEAGDDTAAAKAQAEELLAKVNAGEDFAALAQEFSADTFSGENGGDLDWIERGNMGDAFDEAAFALAEVGQVSDVVESEFGFHVIKLTELSDAESTPFEEVKDAIFETVSKQKAQDKFFELQQEMARLSFEFPDTLEDAAGAVGAEVKTSSWLHKFGNVAPFDSPAAIEAAFSDLVVNEQANSDIIEVNDDLVMVVRVNEYQAASVKPLAEVDVQIRTALTSQKTGELAQSAAEEVVVMLNEGADVTEKMTTLGANFESKVDVARFGSEVNGSISREAFKLPHPKEGKSSLGTAKLAAGDVAVVEVTAVKTGTETSENPALAQQQTQQLAQSAYVSFVESLKVGAKITRKEIVAASNEI